MHIILIDQTPISAKIAVIVTIFIIGTIKITNSVDRKVFFY